MNGRAALNRSAAIGVPDWPAPRFLDFTLEENFRREL
jgi:hypothetical protein